MNTSTWFVDTPILDNFLSADKLQSTPVRTSLTSQHQSVSISIKQQDDTLLQVASLQIVIDRSMTLFKTDFWIVSLTGQWHFLPTRCGRVHLYKTVIDRSMTVFSRHAVAGCTFTKCHWPVNDIFQTDLWIMSLTGQWRFLPTRCGRVHLYKIVIDRSMTLFKRDFWIVSLTGQWHFLPTRCGRVHLYKTVIDWSMTVSWKGTLRKCHWPIIPSSLPGKDWF